MNENAPVAQVVERPPSMLGGLGSNPGQGVYEFISYNTVICVCIAHRLHIVTEGH